MAAAALALRVVGFAAVVGAAVAVCCCGVASFAAATSASRSVSSGTASNTEGFAFTTTSAAAAAARRVVAATSSKMAAAASVNSFPKSLKRLGVSVFAFAFAVEGGRPGTLVRFESGTRAWVCFFVDARVLGCTDGACVACAARDVGLIDGAGVPAIPILKRALAVFD